LLPSAFTLRFIFTASTNRLPLVTLKQIERVFCKRKERDHTVSLFFVISTKEQPMPIRGIRGATTVTADEPDLILQATCELFEVIIDENTGLYPEDIASVTFTMTDDLVSTFPPQAVRQMGWHLVPMICMQEIPVPISLPHAIRVLLLWNTDKTQFEINHIYLRNAINLRPDLTTNMNRHLIQENIISANSQNTPGVTWSLNTHRRKI